MFMYTCNVTQILPECFRDVVKLDSSLTAVIKKKKKKWEWDTRKWRSDLASYSVQRESDCHKLVFCGGFNAFLPLTGQLCTDEQN